MLQCVLDEACDVTKTADVAAIVMEEGIRALSTAFFSSLVGRGLLCLISGSLTLIRAKLEVSIPKKRQMNQSQRDKVK